MIHIWLLFSTTNLLSFICFWPFIFSCFFPCAWLPSSYTILPTSLLSIYPVNHLFSHLHLSSSFLTSTCQISHCYTLTYPVFLSALYVALPPFFLVLPTRPFAHPCVDWERHVPEQDKRAARSWEGWCPLFPSLLCIFHLFTPLPHSCARHPWISGGRNWGAGNPKARRKWGCCRRGRSQWWWQHTIKCGRGTPAPVAHFPEHHRCACPLYGYYDCWWVGFYVLYPALIMSHLTACAFFLCHSSMCLFDSF